MTKKIFYEKIGRRYKPVYEYDQTLMDAFPKGAHLVMCYPGGQSTRYNVKIDYAPLIAAARVAEDAICSAIHRASEAKPKEQPITERQRKAWQEMKAAFGDEFFSLNYGSIRDYSEAGIKAMIDEAEKLMTNPSVKKAYEHFHLVCELTKENQT